jgi:hypothetical protein
MANNNNVLLCCCYLLAFTLFNVIRVEASSCWDSNNCCASSSSRASCNNSCIAQCVCQFYGLPSCCTTAWTSSCTSAAQSVSQICYYPRLSLPQNCTQAAVCSQPCPPQPTTIAGATTSSPITTTSIPTTTSSPTTIIVPTTAIVPTTTSVATTQQTVTTDTSTLAPTTVATTQSPITTQRSTTQPIATTQQTTTTSHTTTSNQPITTQSTTSEQSTNTDQVETTSSSIVETSSVIDTTPSDGTNSEVDSSSASVGLSKTNQLALTIGLIIAILFVCGIVLLITFFRRRIRRGFVSMKSRFDEKRKRQPFSVLPSDVELDDSNATKSETTHKYNGKTKPDEAPPPVPEDDSNSKEEATPAKKAVVGRELFNELEDLKDQLEETNSQQTEDDVEQEFGQFHNKQESSKRGAIRVVDMTSFGASLSKQEEGWRAEND